VATIDAGLRQQSLPDIAQLDELSHLLQDAIRDIDRITATPPPGPGPAPASVPLAPDELRERLTQLGHALAYDLGNAEPLLAELRAGVADTPDTPLAETIAAIAAHVEVFEIDVAQGLLRDVQERLESVERNES
jgi:hypothetical protein